MHIQSSQQNPSFVAELSQAVAGRLGQVEARQVATPREAQQLAQRQEAPKGEGLLSRLGAALARPFVAIIEWLGKLLGSRAHASTQAPLSRQDAPPAASLSAAEIKQMMLQKALPLTLGGLGKASELATLTAERLAKDHTRLASGDSALRSLATALVGIRDGSRIEASRTQAARLLEQSEGEPVDKALADGLVEHFGLEAEQYLGEHPDGPYSDAEVMALGLYTNGEYQHLNRSLRQGRELDAGQALIDRGMSAAFEKSGPAEQVVKTFRGTQGRDAFEAVKEGQVGHDAGYLSTSRDPSVARSFAGLGTITTLFGRSGIDVSEISIEGDEQEILYDKGTDMRVLLSAKDGQGVTRRVLEEATLGERSGHGEGLLDALDLATGTDRSGKPQEQDLRLRMRGLDLA
ncbi:TPA: ADP-ribosyltransferase [Pseudomonas aeruginosa]